MENAEPVVVYYGATWCHNCTQLSKIWNTPTKDSPSVVDEIRKAYPKMRFVTVTSDKREGVFDENLYPTSLRKFAAWFPMILLVPGPVWNAANAKLGPSNNVEFKGVQIMNGRLEGERVVMEQKYRRGPAEFRRWVEDALKAPEFRAEQYKIRSHQPLVTSKQPSPKPEKRKKADVCSMRIISRP